jgi:MFS family permease
MTKATTTDRVQSRADARARGLPRYLITAVLIRLADEGARVGLLLLALERTESAAVGSLLVAALLVPQVVAAPAIGLLTDRARQPRWVLTTTVAGFAASLASVALLLGRAPLPVVVGRTPAAATSAHFPLSQPSLPLDSISPPLPGG